MDIVTKSTLIDEFISEFEIVEYDHADIILNDAQSGPTFIKNWWKQQYSKELQRLTLQHRDKQTHAYV